MAIESGKLATGAAIVISSAAILSSLIFVARMNSEITELYRSCMDDMQEFNKLTNDAWTEMQVMEGNEPIVREVKQQAFASFFRSSRQAGLPPQCNCGLQPNNCPRGPAGAKGRPGLNGEPGIPGLVGTPGMSGMALGEEMYPHSCIQCPAGERGPQGPKGRTGPVGPPGSDGENAPPVAAGQPDIPPGEAGEKGPDGLPGPNGSPGVDGEDGIKYLDSPAGEKDKPPGEIGDAGDVGLPGEDGESEAGPAGDEGPQGLAGIPGAKGAAGEQGSIGLPGQDGSYCPCPSRSSIVQPAEAKRNFRGSG
ncbi:Col-cuticle-N domain-containing protein [Aphelenchoides besseyi]|nr:Col-cuticle-N domain-containing protein [Aphelenchoides besseyi]